MFINMLQLILGYLESLVGQPLPTFPGKEFPATLARSQAQCPLSGGRLPSARRTVCDSWRFYRHQGQEHAGNSVSFRVPHGLNVDPGVEDVNWGTEWCFFLSALPHLHLQPEKVFSDAQRQSPVRSPSAPHTQPRAWPHCWSAALPQRTGPYFLILFLLFSLLFSLPSY